MVTPTYKVRAATEKDITQVQAIYSHYVSNTVLAFMQTVPPLQAMVDKYRHNTITHRLPYLVAVDTSTAEEIVLGYAYLSPFRGTMFSYGPTVELSLFLSPDHTSKGIGSCLLADLLARLVQHLPDGEDLVLHRAVEHAGYQSHENVSEPMPVRNVIACMSLDPDGKDQGEGLRKWYEQRGFKERGRLERVGFKKGKWLNTVYLQYTVPANN